MPRHRSVKAAYLPFASVLLALAACQPALLPAVQTEAKLPHAEVRATALGTVRIKVDSLRQELTAGKGLKTQAAVSLAQATRMRLTAKGPGMTPVSTTIVPEPTGLSLNLRVPIGRNRLIVFEALDANGYPLLTLRAPVAEVTAEAQEINLNANTDVGGRTLERLLALQGSHPQVATILAVEDLVPRLHTYVGNITGYDTAANTYRYVPPRFVRSEVLVQRMLTLGWQVLNGDIPSAMFYLSGGTVPVTVTDPQGNPVAGAQVQVLDPASGPVITGADGRATVTNVPAGTWTVRATSGTLLASNTITVLDQETLTTTPLTLRPPRTDTPTGTTLTEELRVLITGTGDPQASASQLTNLAERLIEGASSEEEALRQLNDAFAATITSEADLEKLAEREPALDGWTLDSTLAGVDRFSTQGFRTAQTEPSPTCGTVRPKLTVLYVNGHLSTYLDFLQTYLVLFHRLRGSQLIPDVKVLGMFNASNADAATRKAAFAALDGSGLFPWLRSAVWGGRAPAFTANGGPNGVPFVEGLMAPPSGAFFTRQVERLAGLIETEFMSGNSVVLMPHGQGNHLAKAALERVKSRAGQGMYGPRSADVRNTLGLVSLGSPIDPTVADFTPNQDRLAVDKDFVTVLPTANARNSMVACSTPAAAVLANCAADAGGRPTVPSPVSSDKALEHHDPVRSYLQGQPWTQLVSLLQRHKLQLVNPFTAAGSGFLQFQLRWQGAGDVDLYIKEPSSNVVYFNRKLGGYGALDVDNIFSYGPENFYVCTPENLQPGDEFAFGVNFYRNRGIDPVPYSVWIKAGNTSKTYTGSVTGANYGASIIGLGRVRIGRDTRSNALTYEILDGGAAIPMQVTIPPGYSLPTP